jgi:hypothetical protein
MLASTAKPSPPTSPSRMQRQTVSSKRTRSRSLSRKRPCRALEKVEWSGTFPSRPSRQNQRIGQVEVDLLAQPPLRADAEAVTHQQHADQQFRIHRGAADRAVERSEVRADLFQVHEPVNRSKQMAGRHVPLQREMIEERTLFDLAFAHHRLSPSRQDLSESAHLAPGNRGLFQHNRPLADLWSEPGTVVPIQPQIP